MVNNKKAVIPLDYDLIICFNYDRIFLYPKAATCLQRADLRLAALFL